MFAGRVVVGSLLRRRHRMLGLRLRSSSKADYKLRAFGVICVNRGRAIRFYTYLLLSTMQTGRSMYDAARVRTDANRNRYFSVRILRAGAANVWDDIVTSPDHVRFAGRPEWPVAVWLCDKFSANRECRRRCARGVEVVKSKLLQVTDSGIDE